MEKVFICIAFLMAAFSSYCQPAVLSKEDYLLKSKHNKTAAIACLVSGAALTTAGILIANSGDNNLNSLTSQITGVVIAGGGVVLMVTSLTLFSASVKNKKRAAALSLKNEKTVQVLKGNIAVSYYPAVSFTIGF